MQESTRQKKFSRLVQKELSDVFLKDYALPQGAMVTISVVRSSPDLALCRIYVSVFPETKLKAVVDALTLDRFELRKFLGNRIRHQVRGIPELTFFPDDTLAEADRMDQILKKVQEDDDRIRKMRGETDEEG